MIVKNTYIFQLSFTSGLFFTHITLNSTLSYREVLDVFHGEQYKKIRMSIGVQTKAYMTWYNTEHFETITMKCIRDICTT